MRDYECPECGFVMQVDDWRYCSAGHDEVAMYEILHWDNKTRLEKLAIVGAV